MNKTVELVNEWGNFEETHPNTSIEDFCRYYLTKQRDSRDTGTTFHGQGIPPTPKSFLIKLLGYIVRLFETYMKSAISDIPDIRQPEDFYFLNAIFNRGECRKSDVINGFLLGMSTGIDVLNRLLANGLIAERSDPEDKRAKLVSITSKGKEVLYQCYGRAQRTAEFLFADISDDDAKLITQLVKNVEQKHTPLVFELKDKSLEELHELVMGKKL
ncbi:MAG: winged helix DNA-binding protein [Bacteroidetes bacterium]|nr:winged helix DNA-binding protein [Bacteroidota bacterium]